MNIDWMIVVRATIAIFFIALLFWYESRPYAKQQSIKETVQAAAWLAFGCFCCALAALLIVCWVIYGF